jgi:hypothetical protein
MDENTWRMTQVFMWLMGIQTTVIIAVVGAMWSSILRKFDAIDKKFESQDKKFTDRSDSLDRRIDRLDEKITDIDRKVCHMDGALSKCCVLSSDSQLKKAE